MRTRTLRPSTSFSVFEDLTASPAPQKPNPQRGAKPHPSSRGCAVLQEVSANKPFALSPNSLVRAEKENFDPVRKQLVRHKETKSTVAPLGERKQQGQPPVSVKQQGGEQGTPTRTRRASTASRAALLDKHGDSVSGPRCPGLPRRRTDDLVLMLSEISIDDRGRSRVLPPPHSRLAAARSRAPKAASTDLTDKIKEPPSSADKRGPAAHTDKRGPAAHTDKRSTAAHTDKHRSRRPQLSSAVTTPPGLKRNIR